MANVFDSEELKTRYALLLNKKSEITLNVQQLRNNYECHLRTTKFQ